MDIKAVCEKYNLNEKELMPYVEAGVIGSSGGELTDDDLSRVCTALLLAEAGLGFGEIVEFFGGAHRRENRQTQIRLLRKLRGCLLDCVHEKQRLLDKVDFILFKLQQDK